MHLKLEGDRLQIQLSPWEKLWALQFNYSFDIPLSHIEQISTQKPDATGIEYRLPGTHVPGLIKAGTYHRDGDREFWYVTSDRHILTLDLKDEYYQRIVLTVNNNQYWLEQINQQRGIPST